MTSGRGSELNYQDAKKTPAEFISELAGGLLPVHEDNSRRKRYLVFSLVVSAALTTASLAVFALPPAATTAFGAQ